MSFEAAAWAIKQQTPSATDKLILILLADCQNSETGLCCPSNSYLQKHAMCSESTVRRSLKTLEEMGLIKRYFRQGKSPLFYLQSNPCQIDTPIKQHSTPVTHDTPTPVTGDTLISNKNKENNKPMIKKTHLVDFIELHSNTDWSNDL